MNNYIKILLIVIFFSGCSFFGQKKCHSIYSPRIYLNKNFLNRNYVGMTRKQIVYIFGLPIISDSFSDVYHYYLDDQTSNNTVEKKMLNLYFKNNRVSSFDIQ